MPDVTFRDKARADEAVLGLRDAQIAWHCRVCGADSTDQPEPERFAVWSNDATVEEIVEWIGDDTAGDEDQP